MSAGMTVKETELDIKLQKIGYRLAFVGCDHWRVAAIPKTKRSKEKLLPIEFWHNQGEIRNFQEGVFSSFVFVFDLETAEIKEHDNNCVSICFNGTHKPFIQIYKQRGFHLSAEREGGKEE